jgi:hypothetical protein
MYEFDYRKLASPCFETEKYEEIIKINEEPTEEDEERRERDLYGLYLAGIIDQEEYEE